MRTEQATELHQQLLGGQPMRGCTWVGLCTVFDGIALRVAINDEARSPLCLDEQLRWCGTLVATTHICANLIRLARRLDRSAVTARPGTKWLTLIRAERLALGQVAITRMDESRTGTPKKLAHKAGVEEMRKLNSIKALARWREGCAWR